MNSFNQAVQALLLNPAISNPAENTVLSPTRNSLGAHTRKQGIDRPGTNRGGLTQKTHLRVYT